MTSVWVAPASIKNMEHSIYHRYRVQRNPDEPYVKEYVWAFNAKRLKSWNQLKIGDIVIFGSNNKKGRGWTRWAFVKSKFIFTNEDDNWPFRSPSGTAWKYAFTLEKPNHVYISPEQMKQIIGHDGFQAQTKTKPIVRDELLGLIQ